MARKQRQLHKEHFEVQQKFHTDMQKLQTSHGSAQAALQQAQQQAAMQQQQNVAQVNAGVRQSQSYVPPPVQQGGGSYVPAPSSASYVPPPVSAVPGGMYGMPGVPSVSSYVP